MMRDPYTSMSELDSLIRMLPPEESTKTEAKVKRMKRWRADRREHLSEYMRDYRKKATK